MNEELQLGVIGDFLLECNDFERLRGFVARFGLQPAHFTDPVLRTAFETLLGAGTDDRVILAQELSRKIGAGFAEKAIARASVSIDAVAERIRRLADAGILAEAKALTEEKMRTLEGSASASAILSDICRELSSLAARDGADDASAGYSLADLAEPVPEEENPNALIRGGWLRKGQAAVLASVTGSGKSVISMQFAYSWAAGREVFGLVPLRPLRIGIFQTEDDDEEIAWFRSSMRKGFATLCGWTPGEITAAEKNIIFHRTEFKSGQAFVDLLANVQRRNRYDLVIINPLQGVCGCNLSDNNEMKELLTEKIDPVIKSPETGCGLFIIHHTNKPTIHNGQQGFGGDQYAEYLGAGAGCLSNWMRAMLAIMPIRNEVGRYFLIAAKRGVLLGWPKREDLKCTKPTRIICHSPESMGIAFWVEDSTVQRPTPVGDASNPKADAERLARDLQKVPRTLTEARKYATELFGRAKGRNTLAYEAVTSDPAAYGLVVMKTGVSTQSLIGSEEGVKNAISALCEKQAQKLLSKSPKNKAR